MILICRFEETYENHEPPSIQDVHDPTKSQEELYNHLCLCMEKWTFFVHTWCENRCKQRHNKGIFGFLQQQRQSTTKSKQVTCYFSTRSQHSGIQIQQVHLEVLSNRSNPFKHCIPNCPHR
jgi:hypothetical protein